MTESVTGPTVTADASPAQVDGTTGFDADPTSSGPWPSLAEGAPADSVDLLRQMLRIRRFEDQVQELFTRDLVRGSTHLMQGQEAIPVGVCAVLTRSDTMTSTYRGHGAVIGKGADLDRCFAEILGKANGLCGGRGGSMHLTDVAIGALGSNAIVGAHLPITVGAALSAKLLKNGTVSVAFFGDGATNIGAFHESLNLAAIWKLPAVFVIENNQYGEYSPIARTTPITRLHERASAYGIPGRFVDGNDVVAVRAATHEAVDRARTGGGPTLIEADTYRQAGHSRSDPGAYRPPGELERWLERDPITLLERAMLASGQYLDADLEVIHAEVEDEVLTARDRAIDWPSPEEHERFKDVYS